MEDIFEGKSKQEVIDTMNLIIDLLNIRDEEIRRGYQEKSEREEKRRLVQKELENLIMGL